MLLFTPRGIELSNKAMEIVAVRLANGFFVNLIYGIFCGILMFMAVKTWQITNGNPFYAMMPVGIFIVCGFNHCVADMFYLHMGCLHFSDYWVLIPTTIGNLIGCNIIPWAINQSSS
jgi:formate/nitrite transporter FocA (FNT family)